jgi:CMP-2-keto-3-deoxyoctulosonic acid synthetase
MIQWVYERAQKSTHLQNLIIATENKRIYDKCQEFGADVRSRYPLLTLYHQHPGG